jgi:DNA-binding LytR/AlgR family response regulator
MKINCIIIDDEPLARKGLKEYIADVDFLHLLAEFDNPLKATDTLMREQVELIFLDIQMPKMTGLEFLKTLSHPPLVIFTTAYPQYAAESFELNVADYLLKPFSFERFWKSVVKARSILSSGHKQQSAGVAESDDYFFIKADAQLVRIAYDDILFVEALQNYVAVYTTQKKYTTYLTFKSMEEHLPPGRFVRTHKSYIVSANKVEAIEGNTIKIGAHLVPISRHEKDAIMEKIVQHRLLKR